jgi:hypothetical protein
MIVSVQAISQKKELLRGSIKLPGGKIIKTKYMNMFPPVTPAKQAINKQERDLGSFNG